MNTRGLHWSLYFLLWTLGISLAGAVLGGISFPALGWLLDWKFRAAELAANGARTLGFFFFVWALPIAIIACIIRGYKRRHPAA
jgi:hypothetical protein